MLLQIFYDQSLKYYCDSKFAFKKYIKPFVGCSSIQYAFENTSHEIKQ